MQAFKACVVNSILMGEGWVMCYKTTSIKIVLITSISIIASVTDTSTLSPYKMDGNYKW